MGVEGELVITNSELKTRNEGNFFRTLEEIRDVLIVYGEGKLQSPGKGTQRLIHSEVLQLMDSKRAIGNLALKRAIDRTNTLPFIDGFITQAQAAVTINNGWFTQNYDYDGVGEFVKTSLGIRVVNRPVGYLFYIGNVLTTPDEFGRNIKERFNAERGFLDHRVVLTLEKPEGDRFEIDLVEVAKRLKDTARMIGINSRILGRRLAITPGESQYYAVLGCKDGVELSLLINSCPDFGENPQVMLRSERILGGRLYHVHKDRIETTETYPPRMEFIIQRNDWMDNPDPIVESAKVGFADALAQEILRSFSLQ